MSILRSPENFSVKFLLLLLRPPSPPSPTLFLLPNAHRHTLRQLPHHSSTGYGGISTSSSSTYLSQSFPVVEKEKNKGLQIRRRTKFFRRRRTKIHIVPP
ncbi:hypothetical protein RHSIM_RhsimUnG0174900 [Rhododendron simsii]|uniref:Uncharacterized protein n=1 Tax=Rhododendron simsii TaxID=118357 RepID=A0A834FWR4_RHOSS|nr:hypothetical protein RHSIM_RhsimUnG0174900 [Rhododendron simsii]